MPRPIVTLLTDFGAGSGFPAQMKGVLLAAAPDAAIVDLSHAVPAYDVLAGALLLEACVPWFPAHAVHCAVVDPGVGTDRRPVVVVDPAGRRLVGPDNGLFTPFLGPGARVLEIREAYGAPRQRSATFHGRDLFGPVAAWIATGGDPSRVGPMVADPVRLAWPRAERRGDELHGECLVADTFGNVATSISARDLAGVRPAAVQAAGATARFVATFGQGEPGELVALVGSSGRLELAVREGSAAQAHGLVRGARVVVRLG